LFVAGSRLLLEVNIPIDPILPFVDPVAKTGFLGTFLNKNVFFVTQCGPF
jgi:hypothetical protein